MRVNRTGGLWAVGIATLVLGIAGPVVASTTATGRHATDASDASDSDATRPLPSGGVLPSGGAVSYGGPEPTGSAARTGPRELTGRPSEDEATAGHPAPVAPVRLGASIATDVVSSGVVRYAVTVRPIGGPAHAVRVAMVTDRPAFWSDYPAGCVSNASATVLACPLEELIGARTLVMSATTNGLCRIAVAANVWATGTRAHSVAMVTVIDAPEEAKPNPRHAHSGARRRSGRIVKRRSSPVAARAATAHTAAGRTAALAAGPLPPLGADPPASAPVPAAGTPVAPPAASPDTVLPDVVAVPPATGDHTLGNSEMTMFTPERALATDRRSWATVIAIAVIAETALAWLVTGRSMWRRGLVHLPRPRRPDLLRSLAGHARRPKSSPRGPVFPWRRLHH